MLVVVLFHSQLFKELVKRVGCDYRTPLEEITAIVMFVGCLAMFGSKFLLFGGGVS